MELINGLRDVIILLLGWLLGLFSPLIVDYLRERKRAELVKKALLTELREFQNRILFLVYRIERSYGELNHEFFSWAGSILKDYNGINSSESLLKTIGPLLNLTKEEMATYAQIARQGQQPESAISLKKLPLSLLESNISSLPKFDPILQSQLLEIKTRIGFVNETVDEAQYYFKLSFQEGISHENYERANVNMVGCYRTCAAQARDIIEIIHSILEKNK